MAMNPPRILVVEDEPKLARLLLDYLHQAGYLGHWLGDGLEVVPWIKANDPAVVLLDVMLPGRDGMDLCRDIRSFSTIPIIMATARVEEIDRLLGLELGADDYVCKPYSPREVVARVKAQLRRLAMQNSPGGAAGGFLLDEDRYLASYSGVEMELTPVEFRLLHAMLGQPGRVFSRDQLLDRIYTDNRVVTDRTVDSHIKNLRRKLKPLVGDDDVIRSIYGVGYKFVAPGGD